VSCLSASFHSIDDFFALVMLPYIVIALICISASIGRVPARMKTAGSATLIYSDRICFIRYCGRFQQKRRISSSADKKCCFTSKK
jgi:hypothetical protein